MLFPHVIIVLFSLEDDDDDMGEDEDEDDGFFVPHGYLSEDEGVTEVRAGWEVISPELGGC